MLEVVKNIRSDLTQKPYKKPNTAKES